MEEYKGYTITIEQDQFADDPLKWMTPEERGAWFLLKHNRYDLPFELDTLDVDDFSSWTELAKATKKPYKFVRWYEHSGIAVSLRDDESGRDWDAGIAGVIIGNSTEEIEQAFTDWKRYIEGDVWFVQITDPEGEVVESVGDNFDDYSNLLDMAHSAVDRMVADDRPNFHTVTAQELHK